MKLLVLVSLVLGGCVTTDRDEYVLCKTLCSDAGVMSFNTISYECRCYSAKVLAPTSDR